MYHQRHRLQSIGWMDHQRVTEYISTFTPLPVQARIIDRVHALANADNKNPALDFFDRLGNPIACGDTPDDDNEDESGDLVGVEEYDNQAEIPGVTTPYQEEIPGVATP